MLPRVTRLRQDHTHRLIPSRSIDESVLNRLTRNPAELRALYELEGATNDRLLGEAGLLPGITVRELVFGLPYSHIVNAAFIHASPQGSRFNGPERGAWYAAFSLHTSAMEVAFHKSQELQEINWREPETFTYVDFQADVRADFHDLRHSPRFAKCLNPSNYAASQRLARRLLAHGSPGIVYPSVRQIASASHSVSAGHKLSTRHSPSSDHNPGTCVACFRPALVTNVRKGGSLSIAFAQASAAPIIRPLK